MTTMIQEKEEAAHKLSETQRKKKKKRQRLLVGAIGLAAIVALVTVSILYLGSQQAKLKLERELQVSEENTRTAREATIEALQSDSLAKLEKQNAELELQEARERIAALEAEIAERNRIEVEKYLASARRMMRVGDREMAHQILLEAQKLDKTNAEIIALLKEIE